MLSRRQFVALAAGAAAAQETYPIIDIHQHTPYVERTADELVRHQREMGIGRTVLLPAGRRLGLAAGAGGNDVVWALAERHQRRLQPFSI